MSSAASFDEALANPKAPTCVNAAVIMRDRPRHDAALHHNRQPREAEKPALETRQPGERMEVQVHAATLRLRRSLRCAPVGRACARLDAA